MVQVAIYVRQSQDKSGNEAAVSRQESACRKLVDAKGWVDPVIYVDNDRSATNGKARPSFERLIRDIEAGSVSAVVVWHLDRLTRSMRDLTRVIEAGKAHKVNIASVHGDSVNLSDPSGVAVAQILTSIAQMEVAHKSNRQREANQQRANAGKAFWTRRPFGYDRVNGKVVVVAAEADAIRSAAAAILAGTKTLAQIARDWNAAGLLTTDVRRDRDTNAITKAGGQWGVTQVRRVLLNPRNAGKRLYNGEEMEQAGEWEPIVTPELLEQLESTLMDPRRRTAPDDLNAKHLLSGILTCGKCGRKMFAAPYKSKGREIMVYRCFGGYCMQRRKDLVDEFVVGVILARLSLPDAASLFDDGQDLGELREQAASLRGRRDALAALLAEGVLSASAVREQAGKLSAELRKVESAISVAEGDNPLAPLIGAGEIEEVWQSMDIANQRQVVRALMDVSILPAGKGVRFSPDQVRITPKGQQ